MCSGTPFPFMDFFGVVPSGHKSSLSRKERKDTHVCASPKFPYMTDFWGVDESRMMPHLSRAP